MLDSNVFNRVLDGQIPLDEISSRPVFATHVQQDELEATTNIDRRKDLCAVFQSVGSEELPTETAVWDVSSWDKAKWSNNDGLYDSLLQVIHSLDNKNKSAKNQIRDALIAETAIKKNLVLVTDDKNLAKAVSEQNGSVISFQKFEKMLKDI